MKDWMWFILVALFAMIGVYGYCNVNDGGHYYLLAFAGIMDSGILVGLGFSYIVREGD